MMPSLCVVHLGWNPEAKPPSGPTGLHEVTQLGRGRDWLDDLPLPLVSGADLALE